ncbi:MAG: TonB-dependent receptor [Tannerellaceae bacterium]|jgi:outer membrane receptor for ferrienterochelin and colicin|nr:TonB-dependent receptor [Tannerellaceae bacterium]
MRRFGFFFMLFGVNFICVLPVGALQTDGDPKRICGYVYDASTHETLKKAFVLAADKNGKEQKNTLTDDEGYFCIQVSASDVQLKISYLGYVHKTLILSPLSSDTLLHVFMEEKSEVLHEVVVLGNNKARDFVETPQMGMLKFNQKEIKNIPTMFGEADVIKALQMQPGVSAGTEGLAGVYVRGGNNDENLYLINGNSLYQTNHLGGLFSSFNPEAIAGVDFYKCAFPAYYGGRLSSVMDVRTKSGDMQEYHGSLMLGIMSGNISVEGPIIKNKTSFVASIRRSWLEALSIPALAIINKKQREKGEETTGRYAFTDLNLRIDHLFDERNRIYFDLYGGRDALRFGEETFSAGEEKDSEDYYEDGSKNKISWGNWLFSLGWKHQFSHALTLDLNTSFTRYQSAIELTSHLIEGGGENRISQRAYDKTSENGVDDIKVRANFDYHPARHHRLNFGADMIHHRFLPENTRLYSLVDSVPEERAIKSGVYGNELGIYLEDDWELFPFLQLKGGFRFNTFNMRGKSYFSPEPRISSRWLISPAVSLKASYARMSQCVQQLSDSYINLPTDSWIPLSRNFKPLTSDQLSAGVYLNWRDAYSFSIESYYKWMDNLIDYKDGYSYLSYSDTWEDKLTSGHGESYGVELMANKYAGRLTGYFSYGLMWNNRQFAAINDGLKFPSKYDNRHKLNIFANWKQNKKLEFNASWTYTTGNRMTLALENYPDLASSGFPSSLAPDYPYKEPWGIDYYKSKNNIRLPAYHRLDVGMNIYVPKKKGRMGIWNISLYNAYCRMNPIVVQKNAAYSDTGQKRRQQFQAMGIIPLIPSISYTYKF